MTLRTLILVAALAVGAGAASAQPPAGGGGGPPPSPEVQAARAAMRAACAADIKTLCADAQGPAVNQCLRTNQSKVSADCAAAMAKLPAPPPR
jgi:hypothetical protein